MLYNRLWIYCSTGYLQSPGVRPGEQLWGTAELSDGLSLLRHDRHLLCHCWCEWDLPRGSVGQCHSRAPLCRGELWAGLLLVWLVASGGGCSPSLTRGSPSHKNSPPTHFSRGRVYKPGPANESVCYGITLPNPETILRTSAGFGFLVDTFFFLSLVHFSLAER